MRKRFVMPLMLVLSLLFTGSQAHALPLVPIILAGLRTPKPPLHRSYVKAFPLLAGAELTLAKYSVRVQDTFTQPISRFFYFNGSVEVTMTADCDVLWSAEAEKIVFAWNKGQSVLKVTMPDLTIQTVSPDLKGLQFTTQYRGSAFRYIDSDLESEAKDVLLKRIEDEARSKAKEEKATATAIARSKLKELIQQKLRPEYPSVIVDVQ